MISDDLKSAAERGSRRREEADSLRLRRLRLLTSAATVRFGNRRISDPCLANAYPGARRAFTLIELLVVIAIIALLAALVVGVGGAAYKAKVQSRVQTELNQLVGAIEAYKKQYGFYPPDNSNLNDSTRPPLYYELVGWSDSPVVITNYFGLGGFVNSGSDAKNFLPNLKAKGYAAIPGTSNPEVRVLMVPALGPAGEFNTWNYRSTKPTNNVETFDLWANVIISSRVVTIGNWKE